MTSAALTDAQVERLIDDGFVLLEQVVPADVVAAGRKVIWADLGQSPDDPTSWTEPVVRLLPSDRRPFKEAFGSPRLVAAFDQLVGAGRWMDRPDLGSFVVRFPHTSDPGDTGWHLDSSFPPDVPSDLGTDDVAGPAFDFSRWRVNFVRAGGRCSCCSSSPTWARSTPPHASGSDPTSTYRLS